MSPYTTRKAVCCADIYSADICRRYKVAYLRQSSVEDNTNQLSSEFHEFAAGASAGFDLDFAFQLQMQEAIIVPLIPSSSSPSNAEYEKSLLLDTGGRGIEDDLVELEALIEALDVAVNLELKQVHVFFDNNSVYQYTSIMFGRGKFK
ncbi:hypothetical protein R6Q59_028065 [Mikania micrantha]